MPEIHLLTGAYALDSLDAVERAGFERHLRGCPSCAIEVAEFWQVAPGLADRVSRTPPPELRGRVLAEVGQIRQVSPRQASMPRVRVRRALVAAAAAVVLVAGAGTGGVAWESHREAIAVQAETGRIARVMTDPSRTEVAGVPLVGGSATLVTAGGSAVFAADRLPDPPVGKAYQLWLVRDGVITPAGVLRLAGGSTQSVVSGLSTGAELTMSVEPSGGSMRPTSAAILTLKVA